VNILANHTVTLDLKGEYIACIAKAGFNGKVIFVLDRLNG
jgi:hypothetical protein